MLNSKNASADHVKGSRSEQVVYYVSLAVALGALVAVFLLA